MKKIAFTLGLMLGILVLICWNITAAPVIDNYALNFGEVGDFKFVMVGPDSRFDTDAITVEAVIYPTSLPTGTYIYEGRSTIIWNGNYAAGHDPYIFYINEYGCLEAYADFQNGGFGEFIIDDNPVKLNKWHHVALTIDSSQMKLYLDGKIVKELTHDRGPTVIGYSYVAIGRHLWYNNPFVGLIDEIRIWDTALSEDVLKRIRYVELTGLEEGLVAYWNFNEGTGQFVYDLSPNEINGVLGSYDYAETNDPAWVVSNRLPVKKPHPKRNPH
ncbi:MAG: LamG domain-containing protein [Gammaproteobacteria bacterium]|nr:LamG domain-containing protein [Gammaproteobacteria bacterium]